MWLSLAIGYAIGGIFMMLGLIVNALNDDESDAIVASELVVSFLFWPVLLIAGIIIMLLNKGDDDNGVS